MENRTEKVKKFENAIIKKSTDVAKALIDEAERKKTVEIDKIKPDIEEKYERKIREINSDVDLEASLKKSRYRNELRQILLRKRIDYKNEIFSEASHRLISFVESEQYKNYLLGKIEKILKEVKFEEAVIYLRRDDEKYFEEIKKLISKQWDVQISDDFKIGGFLLFNPENNCILNESIDEILSQQEQWFYDHSNLSVIL